MSGYAPLFDTLTKGTLCGRWPDIGLWPILLSLADRDGVIDVIPRAIAVMSGIEERELVECIKRFEDKGWLERIYPHLDWGWKITGKAECIRRAPLRPAALAWAAIRKRIFFRDDFTCRYCGSKGGELECDHVMPISRGGSNDDDNLVTACRKCNRSKRNKTPAEWLVNEGA